MSFEQDYSIESEVFFLNKFMNLSSIELIAKEMKERGYELKVEKYLIKKADPFMYETSDLIGYKITLTKKGMTKIFIPRLVKKFSSNGNYQCDYYEYRQIDEKIIIKEESEGEI